MCSITLTVQPFPHIRYICVSDTTHSYQSGTVCKRAHSVGVNRLNSYSLSSMIGLELVRSVSALEPSKRIVPSSPIPDFRASPLWGLIPFSLIDAPPTRVLISFNTANKLSFCTVVRQLDFPSVLGSRCCRVIPSSHALPRLATIKLSLSFRISVVPFACAPL